MLNICSEKFYFSIKDRSFKEHLQKGKSRNAQTCPQLTYGLVCHLNLINHFSKNHLHYKLEAMFSTRNFVIFLKNQLSIRHFFSNQKPLLDIALQSERLQLSVTVEEQITLLNGYH